MKGIDREKKGIKGKEVGERRGEEKILGTRETERAKVKGECVL